MGQMISRHFTTGEGQSIHALISNESSAETILCLSGFGCSHYNFLELVKDLGSSYTMVLIDNRGMGLSLDSQEEYTLDELVADSLAVMDQLGVTNFHVAGISMGGFVAQLLTLQAPERVRSLSLLCTTSGGSEFLPLPPLTESGLTQFYSLAEPRRTEIAVEATVHPSLKEDNFGRFQGICELRRDHPVRVDQVLLQKRAVDKFLQTQLDLGSIECPTFILTGSDDRFVAPENSKKLNKLIKGSKFFSIEKSDHLFFLERPRRVGEVLIECLGSLRSVSTKLENGVTL